VGDRGLVVSRLRVTLLVLGWSASAAAQCTAYLAPPDLPFFLDKDGKKTLTMQPRRAPVLVIPAMTLGSKLGFKLHEGPVFDELGACRPEDAKFEERTHLMKFWFAWGPTGNYAGVWLHPSDLIALPWGPLDTGFGPQNVHLARKAAVLALDKMANASFKPPEIEAQRVFPAAFDTTWAALVETLSDQKWQSESIDKSSGLVTTKPAIDRRTEVMACATAFDSDHRVWLNVFVKAVDGGTRVKVNATFHALRDEETISCYSNGRLERELFEGISKNLQ
jgi:hypothetical protein